ncbi:uncharacterized protein LOC143300575 [Babylonia areolata]|uniref:uncharacterized protein LOC143300575 n=1 Tax=Babylonia areolata TaxID=304850 RepID=UPI003FD3D026
MAVRLCFWTAVAVVLYRPCDVHGQTSSPPPPSPLDSTTPCVASDKLSTCHLYDKATACGALYEAWARDNCPVYCGYCRDAHPTSPPPCEDALDNCAAFGPEACKGQYLPWATDNCRKTCNLCSCVDKLDNCQRYGRYACVGHYEAWARDNCAKTCGLCDHSPQQRQPTPPNPLCTVPSGQTLLMKAVAGAPGDVWHLWSSPNTAIINSSAAVTLDSHVVSHYKSPKVNNLDTCDFDTIKVSIYKDCVERASLTFRGGNSGREDWFSASRLISSSFGDLSPSSTSSSSQPLFQLYGEPSTGREFYVGGAGTGCSGSAWFFVSTRRTCPVESPGPKPSFLFASGHTAQPLQNGFMESGDVLAIFGQGGSCSPGVTTPHSAHAHKCTYKNQEYREGQWWQDGCQYNCTCVDAARDFHQCYDLCVTYTNVPPTCPLVKAPGQCCATPTCVVSADAGCMYQSKVYQQGETWYDGCDYKCTCVDGASGHYQCSARCLQFQLPAECHMDPAPAGRCCPVPACPSNVHLHYPDGYVPE